MDAVFRQKMLMNLSMIGKNIYILIMNSSDDWLSESYSHIIYSP